MSIVEIFAEKLQFFSFYIYFGIHIELEKYAHKTVSYGFQTAPEFQREMCIEHVETWKKVVETYGPSNQFVNGLKRHLLISNFIDLLSACIDTQHIDIHG